jgi:N-acetylmuramic acid 6-phosphate (MurNAc-6-P) etherase
MMINLKPSNRKLRARMIRIVCELKGCSEQTAEALLDTHNWNIREAVGE